MPGAYLKFEFVLNTEAYPIFPLLHLFLTALKLQIVNRKVVENIFLFPLITKLVRGTLKYLNFDKF